MPWLLEDNIKTCDIEMTSSVPDGDWSVSIFLLRITVIVLTVKTKHSNLSSSGRFLSFCLFFWRVKMFRWVGSAI
jgi:hypothetical protein